MLMTMLMTTMYDSDVYTSYDASMSDAGMELDTIRRMMRHDRIETTLRCYLYADPRKMDVATAGVEGAIFG